ncbi:MAG: hydroxymethylbilane synthase [Planctomycetota bacterium]
MATSQLLRIGTRASKLARWQADWTARTLRSAGVDVEIVEIATTGDQQQSGAIASLNRQGVFTKEIQRALLEGEVDAAVHSLKDLPTETVAGLALAATPTREDPADALVARHGETLESLGSHARVGTGSLRRRVQLSRLRPDLEVVGIRGNVDSRLRKLDEGQYDAVVLAVAGLTRLGLADKISERLEFPRLLPAPGQGALGIECREGDGETRRILASLDHQPTRVATNAERAMLSALHGGCSAPIAAWGRLQVGQLLLDGLVADPTGKKTLLAHRSGDVAEADRIAREVADDLMRQGAEEIIRQSRTG